MRSNAVINELIQDRLFNGYKKKKITPDECFEFLGDIVADELAFDNDGKVVNLKNFAGEMSLALQVVEKLQKDYGLNFYLSREHDFIGLEDWCASFDEYEAWAEKPEKATCLAALKALKIR
ncbi:MULTISPECIES: BC1872 family protein [Bacillus]|uniref:BC1872 family protein n=1 Tax=Bacillus TaxID=1386 RepID=UPI000617138B|nr:MULTISPECIES: hypothetical protein [Bacillus]KKB71949.1 hypothetical protein TH62_20325 [Bacillus sp. TH008]WKB79265.1 hypothetical protein QYM22_10610 [Bacillus glycinifermentans]SCA85848.1 hypothetical protein BGLY_2025 [Bacillus glycinifermentans]